MDPNVSLHEGWTAPRELTAALPRQTRIEKRSVAAVVIMALVELSISVSLFFNFRKAEQEMAQMSALRRGSSRETTGEVKWVWRGTNAVSYASTANGVALTGECFLPKHLHFRRGDTLLIRFLSSNPAINHPAAWEGPEPDWSRQWVAWMFFLLGGIWLICVLRWDRQLLAEGVPTPGFVISSPTSARKRRVKYQFRMPDGRVAEGSSYCGRSEIGSTVCVLYLPQNPRRNMAYLPPHTYRVAR